LELWQLLKSTQCCGLLAENKDAATVLEKAFYHERNCGKSEIFHGSLRKEFLHCRVQAAAGFEKAKAPNTRPGALANLIPFAGITQIKFFGSVLRSCDHSKRLTAFLGKFLCLDGDNWFGNDKGGIFHHHLFAFCFLLYMFI